MFLNVFKYLRNNARLFSSQTRGESLKVKNEVENSLTDLFGRHHTYLRISLSEKCNLRCQYCMPEAGVKLSPKDDILTTDEIIHLANLFATQGVRKIRLTGGEPTVRRDLQLIIEKLKNINGIETIAMTTNGLTLTRQLVGLQKAGLDILNISLDTLKPEKFNFITRRAGFDRVIMGIDLALQLGYSPVKINCVSMKGFNDDEILDFVRFTKDRNVDVRFIEYMPFTGNKWDLSKLVPYKDMVALIKEEWPDFYPLKNAPNDTSKAWKVPNYKGQVGFITSMTEHFCNSCNRIRLTADGNLKVCLFGNKEVSLRDALRNGITEENLVRLISQAIKNKKKQHAVSVLPKLAQINLPPPLYKQSMRAYSTLSHLDEAGRANMVDVTGKNETLRTATARGLVRINHETTDLIKQVLAKKGDVLSVAQLAGIMGAKKTSELIPLCHNIFLSKVHVEVKINYEQRQIELEATVRTVGKTGVEMEALTAVSVAALAVYDMCKSVSHNITISEIMLIKKTGGKSDYRNKPIFVREDIETLPDGSEIRVGAI